MTTINNEVYAGVKQLWRVLKHNYNINIANEVVHSIFDEDDFSILDKYGISITNEFRLYNLMNSNNTKKFKVSGLEKDPYDFND